MSDASSTDNSSETEPSTSTAPVAGSKSKTSRTGRIVIGILMVVVAVEGIAHFRVTRAKSALSDELAKAATEDHRVNRATVQQLLGDREPDLTRLVQAHVGKELYDVYYYNGLLKQRVLCVHYGVQGEKDADDSQREMMEVLTVVPEAVLFADGS